jgi:hypothetical protein
MKQNILLEKNAGSIQRATRYAFSVRVTRMY